MKTEDLIRNKYPDLYKDLEKEELGFVSEGTRKMYLFCYNLFMFCGFLYVFAIMNIRYAKLGDNFVKEAYSTVGNPMKMLHLMMILEFLHPIFGYTKGSPLPSFCQGQFHKFEEFFFCGKRQQNLIKIAYLKFLDACLDLAFEIIPLFLTKI